MTARVLNDNPQVWVDRRDSGSKQAICSNHEKIMHTRVYGDADDGHIDSIQWGFAVIATTHLDWGECPFGISSGSGYSEQTEYGIGYWVQHDYGHGLVVKRDAVDLHNKEGWPTAQPVGSHVLWNDGRATTIWMPDGPVDTEHRSFQSCESCGPGDGGGGSGSPDVTVTTTPGDIPGRTWVSWNSSESGGSIAFCRAYIDGVYYVDTAPAGGPQYWNTTPGGEVSFTCWDTQSPQNSSSASAPTY
jgi:hypothetical protein